MDHPLWPRGITEVNSFSWFLQSSPSRLLFPEKPSSLGNELLFWVVSWYCSLCWQLSRVHLLPFSARVPLHLEVAWWDRTPASHVGSCALNEPHLTHKKWWGIPANSEFKQSQCCALLILPPSKEVAYQVVLPRTSSLDTGLEISMPPTFWGFKPKHHLFLKKSPYQSLPLSTVSDILCSWSVRGVQESCFLYTIL